MIECLSASFERLKTAVVDSHKGKLELSQMDDVLHAFLAEDGAQAVEV